MEVAVEEGPPIRVRADQDQLEELLINVISNAVQASQQTHPAGDDRVAISWCLDVDWLEVCVDDNGPGLAADASAFVPFYTTKEHGSGIGLALSRQIAEAHGGSLTLANHRDAPGCRATLRLSARS
jgi:two-component system nitrogen regulation sensor histidine kinase NtrY